MSNFARMRDCKTTSIPNSRQLCAHPIFSRSGQAVKPKLLSLATAQAAGMTLWFQAAGQLMLCSFALWPKGRLLHLYLGSLQRWPWQQDLQAPQQQDLQQQPVVVVLDHHPMNGLHHDPRPSFYLGWRKRYLFLLSQVCWKLQVSTSYW